MLAIPRAVNLNRKSGDQGRASDVRLNWEEEFAVRESSDSVPTGLVAAFSAMNRVPVTASASIGTTVRAR